MTTRTSASRLELVVLSLLVVFACACASEKSEGDEAAAVTGAAGVSAESGRDSSASTAGAAGMGRTASSGTAGSMRAAVAGGSGGVGDATPRAGAGAGAQDVDPGTSNAGAAGAQAQTAGAAAAAAAGRGVAGETGDATDTTGAAGSAGQGGQAETGGAASEEPRRKKFVGNITTSGQVRSDFIEYWDQLTPENEGKWGSVERQRDQMDWSGLDAAYNYAKEHGLTFKQHTFVWGSQQPGWIDALPQAEQREEVEEWIRLYCERYPDTQLIDVVNEPPPHTTPSYAAALGGEGSSGYDWIVQAFEWARQYCPSSTLILNDYNNIEYDNDSNHFIDIANRVKSAGAPIDALGAQAHDAYNLSADQLKRNLDKLASSTGLPVYISEYDINLPDDARQESVMAAQFPIFWDNDKVKGITLWGYIEGRTWRANTGLMSDDGRQRPAMTWLLDFLQQQQQQ